MTTVSAVVFLWAPGTELASVAVIEWTTPGRPPRRRRWR
jgi:hypothetical protein